MAPQKIRILVVEDHSDLRLGLTLLLEQPADFQVVGEAANGRQAVEMAKNLTPDLVLMDVGMPLMDGIEACRTIKALRAETKVIMLTSHDNDTDVFAALAAGANGYCLKGSEFERFVDAIRAVARGDLWLDSAIAGKVLEALPANTRSTEGLKNFEALSPRETEVLRLLVEGYSNHEIGKQLDISLDTVKTHVRHIMDKMAVSDRTQAAVKALRHGLV